MKTQFKDFPKEMWDTIYSQIDLALKEPGPHYAAFDADGTLWDNDVGNSFFDYEIDNKLIPLPEEPWEHVYTLKEQDPRLAFLWLAQIHKNIAIKTVQEWALTSFKNTQFEIFPPIKKLISYLKSKKVEVFVVTASVKWAVEPCVASLDIPPENVLGIQTKIKDGIVTDIQEGAITYREGKTEALLQKTKNKKPLLACGNTMGDFWLLDAATHVKLAVRTDALHIGFKDKDITNQELNLYKEATTRGWLTHNFL
jgi:phosphoserine phosphatase